MSNDFGGRAGFDMKTSHIFSQAVPPYYTGHASIPLWKDWGWGGEARARAKSELGLPLLSGTTTTLSGPGLGPEFLK